MSLQSRCVLKAWEIPEELLVLVCVVIPLKSALILVKECCSTRIYKLASKSESKQAKAKFPYSVSFYVGYHQKKMVQI